MSGLIVIVIIGGCYYLYLKFSVKWMVCRDCGHLGQLAKTSKGSLLVEIVLWLCLLLPGLIYSAWRMSNRAYQCPTCSGWNLVPADSPKGLELVAGDSTADRKSKEAGR